MLALTAKRKICSANITSSRKTWKEVLNKTLRSFQSKCRGLGRGILVKQVLGTLCLKFYTSERAPSSPTLWTISSQGIQAIPSDPQVCTKEDVRGLKKDWEQVHSFISYWGLTVCQTPCCLLEDKYNKICSFGTKNPEPNKHISDELSGYFDFAQGFLYRHKIANKRNTLLTLANMRWGFFFYGTRLF